MKNPLLCLGIIAFVLVVSTKSEYYSDAPEDEYTKLQEIAGYLRRRIDEAQKEEVEEEDEDVGGKDPEFRQFFRDETRPPFEYTLPKDRPSNDMTPFAVGPSDPRFYLDFGSFAESTQSGAGISEAKEKRPEVFRKAEVSSLSDEVPMVSDNKDPTHSAVRQVPVTGVYDDEGKADIYFTAIVAGCSAAAVVAVIAVGIGCYRLQKNAKAAADVDYPAYGVTGPNKDISPTSGDRRLAQSAQMYHYQHQKQQIIAMESMTNKERRSSMSEAESEEENEEGDYTVYECPGLAPTGEMEVKNPLFQDDQTPASTAKPAANEFAEDSPQLPK